MKLVDRLSNKTKKILAYYFVYSSPLYLFLTYILGRKEYIGGAGVLFIGTILLFRVYFGAYLDQYDTSTLDHDVEDYEMELINVSNYSELKEKLIANLVQYGIDHQCEMEDLQKKSVSDSTDTIYGYMRKKTDNVFGFQIIRTSGVYGNDLSKSVTMFWRTGHVKAKLEEDRKNYLGQILFVVFDKENLTQSERIDIHKYLGSWPYAKYFLMGYNDPYFMRQLRCGILMDIKKGYLHLFVPTGILTEQEQTIKDMFLAATAGVLKTKKIVQKLDEENEKME